MPLTVLGWSQLCAASQHLFNNNIKINNEDNVAGGLAGWMASAKAIVSSLLRGAVQAPQEKGMLTLPFSSLCAVDFVFGITSLQHIHLCFSNFHFTFNPPFSFSPV
jgi:hypothetical protein